MMIEKHEWGISMSNNLAICDDCGKEVSVNAKVCPNCGCVFSEPISVSHKVCAIVFSLFVPLVGFILGIIGLSKGDKVCCRIALILSILIGLFHLGYYSLLLLGA